MQHHTHRAYISLELLLAVIILGVAFKIFWKFYGVELNNQIFLDKDNENFLAQVFISDKIYKKDFEKDFTIVSKNGITYQGKFIETQVKNKIYYRYFFPQTLVKTFHSNESSRMFK